MSYPKWLYHRTEPARIVNNPAEHAALPAGWAETPAAFERADSSGSVAAPAVLAETPPPATTRKKRQWTQSG